MSQKDFQKIYIVSLYQQTSSRSNRLWKAISPHGATIIDIIPESAIGALFRTVDTRDAEKKINIDAWQGLTCSELGKLIIDRQDTLGILVVYRGLY